MLVENFAPLQRLNTFGIQARAHRLLRVRSASDVAQWIASPERGEDEPILLGGGSNIVITGDLKPWVLKVDLMGRALVEETDAGWLVEAAAGEDWHAFVAAYKRIILRAVGKMKPDTFACFVVGDFRDSRGFYRNFVSETIDGFEQAGARLYNEAILATPVGTAAMRVTKQFESGRKLAKTHQNVLVFCKGDWKKAAARCAAGIGNA